VSGTSWDKLEQLERLFATIQARRTADPSESYVARRLARGPEKAAEKLGEEAVETAIAAAAGDREGVVAESADLLFHLMLLWSAMGVDPAEVMAELAKGEGSSGLAEKQARQQS